ncbi:M3 family oligoendopeptidase [Siccirubricoccus sp. KC 17139]|uniref:M3 family oligoendopeptidase n=1 Tax=Siccirubricoccus soli TaxID=2899147 RepID=A0ABT1DB35_9PROT|nr:M3 family oligoendopeptidase [Siccirubricoccus soli]MCO6418787.1 M3 family oligoendopeptidase [Siccirubricoccus soli]MCP2684922.1 M3 family oligoendopeptidase [Siccirubricoccus soli]
MTAFPRFADLAFPTPTEAGLAAEARSVLARIAAGEVEAALAEWDAQRRAYESWASLVHLRFSQDTTSPEAKAAREYADALAPVATEHEVAVKRALLALPDRAALERLAGRHAVQLWETDITTFDPAIKVELEEEAKLGARYTELLASAKLEIGGQVVNLSGLAPFAESPDREMRHRAEALRWGFFAQHGAALDGIYDELVRLRHGMAVKLGFPDYTPLGYRRMRRTDYGPAEVARYREEVLTHVTPLVGRLLEARRQRLGWDRLRFWDEALIDPEGNPKPIGDHDVLVAAAQAMFDRLDPRLAEFYRGMEAGGFLDMKNRPGKAGGGFCTSFPTIGTPFIFANFNGTHHDIGVFTHEMGHAFQNWESRFLPGIDYLWPTMESAEIHSMSLEFLTLPQIGLLVGEGAAERFRRMHLEASLAFLPYGVCVDHFQHEVYARPEATPEERHAIWQRLERRYMPWTDYGDLAWPAKGGRWQAKPHIYRSPFYYIDYTLALCCALQFWVKSRHDPQAALAEYVALCGRGGSAPFQALVASAGLISPFQPGALEAVVREAEAVLAD